jgi:hypothetical protein
MLDIKRGVSVTPIETYVSWNNHYSRDDMKLVVLYHLRNDLDFLAFERTYLLNNKLFHDFKQLDDGKGVYIFDFSEYSAEWDILMRGAYSELPKPYKRRIENFYGRRDPNYAYVESFLFPERYYTMYADLIGVEESLLKEVKELCSKFDFDKETLEASVKNLELKSKIS